MNFFRIGSNITVGITGALREMNNIRWAIGALLLTPALAASADTVTFGRWKAGLSPDKNAAYAGNSNDSGSILAKTCSTSKDACMWIVSTDSECDNGSQYPFLINSDLSATAMTAKCLGISPTGKLYRYEITGAETLEGVLLKAKRVGLAFPMQSDQFKVIRFQLDGIEEAVPFVKVLAAEAIAARTDYALGETFDAFEVELPL